MIINQLRNAAGRSEKEWILQQHATAFDKMMFRYTYDKVLSYGVKFDAMDTCVHFGKLQAPRIEDFSLLDRLAVRELSGNSARAAIYAHCRVYGPLVMFICNKDLDCGVSAITVNKVFDGVIPQFNLQKAKEIPISKIKVPCLAETKLDGVRIGLTINSLNEVIFKTYNGLIVPLPYHTRILQKARLEPCMLDTEVTFKSGKLEDRPKISGMITSAMKGGNIDESKLYFNVFDWLGLEEFERGECKFPQKQRRVFED